MQKLIFLDLRELDVASGFARRLQHPHKYPGNPLLVADQEWENGNLQPGTDMRHQRHWVLEPQRAGLGMASLRPDGFVALEAGDGRAELLTVAFVPAAPRLFVNAAATAGGWVRVAVTDDQAHPAEIAAYHRFRPLW
ncbi:MAG: hypothetical protein AB1505_20745 [Candidatus Latescibacterota bacterium]